MDPASREIIGLVLSSSTALAGILLVFSGFMFSKAESAGTAKRQAHYARIARVGLIPVATCLVCTWISLDCLQGFGHLYAASVWVFKTALLMTFVYALVVLFFYI